MSQYPIAAVKTEDVKRVLGVRPFIALPQEEIERFYASIEVFPAEKISGKNPELTSLLIFVAVHYNYIWVTNKNKDACSLGFTGQVHMKDFNGLFLDESLSPSALRVAEQNLHLPEVNTVRLSGLLNISKENENYLTLIYIIRLKQPGAEIRDSGMHLHLYGSGELQQHRDQFDSESRFLIDHITAF